MKIIQIWFLGLVKLGMMKWSLKIMRSALEESFLLVLITQVDTGHCSLMKTPLPGFTPQPDAPVQNNIFFNGRSEELWSIGNSGGRKLSWLISLSPEASSGNKDTSLCPVLASIKVGPGLLDPPSMYQALVTLVPKVTLVSGNIITLSPPSGMTSPIAASSNWEYHMLYVNIM